MLEKTFCKTPWIWEMVVITVCKVVQNRCKGDEPCQWNTPIFRPSGGRKPLSRSTWNLTGVITSGTSPQMQTLVFLSPRGGAVVHMRVIVIIRVYFYTPLGLLFISCTPVEIAPFNRFSCFMAQKTCFGDSYVLFGVRTKIFNNFHYFSQKNAKFPIPAM